MGLRTEYSFTLPKGYVDQAGTLHRQGTMRLATARDEIEPLRDPRIGGAEDPYLTIIVLSRVITELGTLPEITAAVVEGLFAADLAFLQDVYGIINFGDPAELRVLQDSVLAAESGADDDLDEVAVIEDLAIDGLAVDGLAVQAAVVEVVELSEPAPAGNVFAAAAAAVGATDADPGPVTASLRHRIEEVRSQLR